MLEYHRYRGAAEHLRERLAAEHGYRYRSAPLPPRAAARLARGAPRRPTSPEQLAEALGDLLRMPPPLDLRHVRRPARVGRAAARATCATCSRGAAASRSTRPCAGADRLTEAVTLFALLELYKAGEARWEQEEPFGPITVTGAT